ncbi:aminoglycoside adenylyltransferase domain-containing protein [Candidatus Hydrogenedentota bacterium]
MKKSRFTQEQIAFALPLCGPPPGEVFGAVPRDWLLDELAENLHWHERHIFDPYHDRLGQFTTLNACRAWYFVECNVFCSKTDGGRWVLSRNPELSLVAAALANRVAAARETPEREEIEALLQQVCGIIEHERTTQPSGRGDAEDRASHP